MTESICSSPIGTVKPSAAHSSGTESSSETSRRLNTPCGQWYQLRQDKVTWEAAYDVMNRRFPDLPEYEVTVRKHTFAEGTVFIAKRVTDGKVEDHYRLPQTEYEYWMAYPEEFKSKPCFVGLDLGSGDRLLAMAKISLSSGEECHRPKFRIAEDGRVAELSKTEYFSEVLRGALAPIRDEVLGQAGRLLGLRAGAISPLPSATEVRCWQRLLALYISELEERGISVPLMADAIDECLDPTLAAELRQAEVLSDPVTGQIERRVKQQFSTSSSISSDSVSGGDKADDGAISSADSTRAESKAETADAKGSESPKSASQTAGSQRGVTETGVTETGVTETRTTTKSWKKWVLYGGGAAFLLVTLGLGAFALTRIKGVQKLVRGA